MLCSPEEVTPTRRLVAKVHSAPGSKAGNVGGSKDASIGSFYIRTLDIDRKLVSRLRERVVLAKKIADAALAKEKGGKEDNWMKNAAEELGVDYDSEEMESVGKWRGRGSGRKQKENEARAISKAETRALRAELKKLLAKRVNVGVSEKYIASGMVDLEELLKDGQGKFLGHAASLGIEGL
jgi:ATP-dependent RNA helicase DDX24/MAK5